jgi:uncharacterized protein (DUF1697 family)
MARSRQQTAWLALLRGINVGGKNILPMKRLAAMFADASCEDVRTFIQSGNVVFRADAKVAASLSAAIAKRIEADLGFRVPVMLRSAEEMAAVVRGNPFLKAGADEKYLHVSFLADAPDPAAVAKLDPLRSPPDEYVVVGREIYAQTPNGLGNSKLTNAYFDAKLKTISTARNWNTVVKLAEMMNP